MSGSQQHIGAPWTRRAFATSLGGAAVACGQAASKPNILWITCEDIGPQIGAYGDRYADTPNIDRLASRGQLYRNAWSTAPVCAPARTTIISGMYPPSTGSEHMRSMTSLPPNMLMYPCYLREMGYYATNNSKEDYNLEYTGKVWDESSPKAHWRKRATGQPFFSIFNFTTTHESQLRRRPHTPVHDPAKAPLPAYHPDTPEVRLDWGQYYDNITTMDGQAGQVLKELEQDGLLNDTIVFFYGDHGPGMPRNKRYPFNCGLQVPFIVHIPDKFRNLAPKDYRAGGETDRLVGFIDLAPTVLSLIGMKPPAHMQGHAFLGRHQAPEQPYLYGFRGRMDERYDMMRTVRDKRYVYVRNYMPHRVYGQHVAYLFQTPTTQVWKKLYDQGKLNEAQSHFWKTKPAEELYDLSNDHDEVNNLAGKPEHKATVERMRKAQEDLAVKIRDVGFLPEDEIHSRAKGSSPYEVGHDDARYPMRRVFDTAGRAASMRQDDNAALLKAFEDSDSAVRYWAAMGMLMRGAEGVKAARPQLEKALNDSAPAVRIAAAEALGRYGSADDTAKALPVLVDLSDAGKHGFFVALEAANALDMLDEKAKPAIARIRALPDKGAGMHPRVSANLGNVLKKTLADLGG